MGSPDDGTTKHFEGMGGWLPDGFDGLDHPYEPDKNLTVNPSENLKTNPKYSSFWPAVYDQGRLSSCVANATAVAYTFEAKKYMAATGKSLEVDPSREFIYWNARTAAVKDVESVKDDGSTLRHALKSLHKYGVCAESSCPYPDGKQVEDDETALYTRMSYYSLKKGDDEKDADFERLKSRFSEISGDFYKAIKQSVHARACTYPGEKVYPDAMSNRTAGYARLDMKTYEKREEWHKDGHDGDKTSEGELLKTKCQQALSEGHPIVLAFRYYQKNQFESDKKEDDETESDENRHYTMKNLPGEHKIPDSKFGGHAVVAYGYDDQGLKIQNSWGPKWNGDGTFIMPWTYVTDFEATNDFWIIKGFREAGNVDDEDKKDQEKKDQKT